MTTFWNDREEERGPLTLLEIRTVLERDVLPYWKGWTLEQIVTAGDEAMRGYRDG